MCCAKVGLQDPKLSSNDDNSLHNIKATVRGRDVAANQCTDVRMFQRGRLSIVRVSSAIIFLSFDIVLWCMHILHNNMPLLAKPWRGEVSDKTAQSSIGA
jgi:hypothetical protein